MEKPLSFWKQIEPKISNLMCSFDRFSNKILDFWKIVEKFKKFVLAVPVGVAAVMLAVVNLFKLPALLGFGLQSNGEYYFEVIREIAVFGPLLLTFLCLLMVFLSKRTLTPWLVSVFSLLLPIVLFITTVFSV